MRRVHRERRQHREDGLFEVPREPRALLGEMGLAVDPRREIRVWDSSAEMRYMVLPQRPSGTEGMGEDALVPLITRDALIGVAEVRPPAPAIR
jgi:nitrile hydratase